MAEKKDGCVAGAAGPLAAEDEAPQSTSTEKGAPKVTAKVGKPAPDFEAAGFFEAGFKNFKLSDYKGKWVVLCFYPGDFTFV